MSHLNLISIFCHEIGAYDSSCATNFPAPARTAGSRTQTASWRVQILRLNRRFILSELRLQLCLHLSISHLSNLCIECLRITQSTRRPRCLADSLPRSSQEPIRSPSTSPYSSFILPISDQLHILLYILHMYNLFPRCHRLGLKVLCFGRSSISAPRPMQQPPKTYGDSYAVLKTSSSSVTTRDSGACLILTNLATVVSHNAFISRPFRVGPDFRITYD